MDYLGGGRGRGALALRELIVVDVVRGDVTSGDGEAGAAAAFLLVALGLWTGTGRDAGSPPPPLLIAKLEPLLSIGPLPPLL